MYCSMNSCFAARDEYDANILVGEIVCVNSSARAQHKKPDNFITH